MDMASLLSQSGISSTANVPNDTPALTQAEPSLKPENTPQPDEQRKTTAKVPELTSDNRAVIAEPVSGTSAVSPNKDSQQINSTGVDSPADPVNTTVPLSIEPEIMPKDTIDSPPISGTNGLPPLIENPNRLDLRKVLAEGENIPEPAEGTDTGILEKNVVTDSAEVVEPSSEVKSEITAQVQLPTETATKAVSQTATEATTQSINDANVEPVAETPIQNQDPSTVETVNDGGSYPYTIDQLLDLVIQKDASDLHLSPGYPAMIRVDGELLAVSAERLTAETSKTLIYSMLPDDIKEVVEVSKETDLAHAHKDLARFRVNVYHAKGSMCAAFRLIPRRIRSIDELKLPAIYKEFAALKQGLVLVTGPTGHGKSTTLAAIISEVNKTRPVHILTIEDPIEYVYPRDKALIGQREMKNDTHSWEIALRSVLREDPDVVLVGEMRDYETISAAITVAETGHLVFATLHTNSASQTIDRIIDVFPEHQQSQIRTQLATVIEAVVSQRLVKLIGGGRRAVSEVMLGSPAVRNIIREGKTYQLDNTIRTSSDIGMISIEKSLVELVREGVLTVEDAQSYAISPEEVVRLLK